MSNLTTIRRSPSNPYRLFLDFDSASPGGLGGAGILYDPSRDVISIDAVHKNINLPTRSTGALIADGLTQAGVSKPAILEGFNVEKSTAAALGSGSDGRGTLIGNMLADTAKALGATITLWEPIRDGGIWHLRIHLSHP